MDAVPGAGLTIYTVFLRAQVLTPNKLYNGQLPTTLVRIKTQPSVSTIIPKVPVTIC